MESKIPQSATRHNGWDTWYHGPHPATGKWRASRFGVEMGAGSFQELIKMIDARVAEERREKELRAAEKEASAYNPLETCSACRNTTYLLLSGLCPTCKARKA